ncbi:MAG: hypothetical protein JNN12_06735 [Bacteroidetes Order II. Incertae sedis bacterium]|nr:hypothetical protein [Bacteroidetes Order II. bacterium]
METTLFELWLKQLQRASQDPDWWKKGMLEPQYEAASTVSEWLNHWKTALDGTGNPAELQKMQDDWHRMMGVVPRQRYLDLLEKYDALQRQLELTEQALRAAKTPATATTDHELNEQMVKSWQQMAEQTLSLQSAWLKNFSGDETPPT